MSKPLWTKTRLHDLVTESLDGKKFIAVSNREPYIHSSEDGRIVCRKPASGLTSALDPIMSASGGVWIAHGSGSADRETADANGCVAVPPGNPAYTLRRVWIPKHLQEPYYYGLANQGLWPLCHIAYQLPRYSAEDWECYRQVNELFAEAILDEAADGPAFVFIQDYHFALLPRMLKKRNPALTIAQFWHIPWPNRETIRTFPWKEELLDGMLGNDLLGFHLRYHCSNFLETVDRTVEALVDNEACRISRGGHDTTVRAFPISIDFEAHSAAASVNSGTPEYDTWRKRLSPYSYIGVGIDRVDYTKGIPERIRAVDLFLEKNPEFRGKLVFVQVGVPSRTRVPQYNALANDIRQGIAAVNAKWRTENWQPILYEERHLDSAEMIALHRLADFCLVTSLHDGMNLVAKEFVASRDDLDGVLILSRFTGSARELDAALLVNPFSDEDVANAISRVFELTPSERRDRMARLRSIVEQNNIYRWAGKILTNLTELQSQIVESEMDVLLDTHAEVA